MRTTVSHLDTGVQSYIFVPFDPADAEIRRCDGDVAAIDDFRAYARGQTAGAAYLIRTGAGRGVLACRNDGEWSFPAAYYQRVFAQFRQQVVDFLARAESLGAFWEQEGSLLGPNPCDAYPAQTGFPSSTG